MCYVFIEFIEFGRRASSVIEYVKLLNGFKHMVLNVLNLCDGQVYVLFFEFEQRLSLVNVLNLHSG